jgi:hypothetical protein
MRGQCLEKESKYTHQTQNQASPFKYPERQVLAQP